MDSCEVVGYYNYAKGQRHTLAVHWNGSSWSRQTTTNPDGLSDGLNGVSCMTVSDCEAVGDYEDTTLSDTHVTLAEGWNGKAWQTQPTPAAPSGSGALNAVSCATARVCEAVGTSPHATLAEGWNGATWQTQDPVNIGDQLQAVSCPSVTFCDAVGGNVVGHWNGKEWTTQTGPLPEPLGVSCPTDTGCEAVGFTAMTPLGAGAEGSNGTAWTLQSLPQPTVSFGARTG